MSPEVRHVLHMIGAVKRYRLYRGVWPYTNLRRCSKGKDLIYYYVLVEIPNPANASMMKEF